MGAAVVNRSVPFRSGVSMRPALFRNHARLPEPLGAFRSLSEATITWHYEGVFRHIRLLGGYVKLYLVQERPLSRNAFRRLHEAVGCKGPLN